ncbi:hypothetical protein U1Q18_003866 [Sarracenia purpurea var. burkii]
MSLLLLVDYPYNWRVLFNPLAMLLSWVFHSCFRGTLDAAYLVLSRLNLLILLLSQVESVGSAVHLRLNGYPDYVHMTTHMVLAQ